MNARRVDSAGAAVKAVTANAVEVAARAQRTLPPPRTRPLQGVPAHLVAELRDLCTVERITRGGEVHEAIADVAGDLQAARAGLGPRLVR